MAGMTLDEVFKLAFCTAPVWLGFAAWAWEWLTEDLG